MNDTFHWPAKFDALGVCVLVPTYNNASTLRALLGDLTLYTRNIVVIDDGSTDDTGSVLASFPAVVQVNMPSNRGKGLALRKGFQLAAEAGYRYAISIDSDGQHFAKDLPVFIAALEETPGTLLIGARNMDQSGVPARSGFGNRFSNFWYWLETGIRLPDTQSGYRVYPLEKLAGMRFFTRKYEFEIEVIVRAAWAGIPVRAVPVNVYYPPPELRISHFRPFRDFTRISLLNTVLVLICFFYVWPRKFFRKFFQGPGWKDRMIHDLFHPEDSDLLKAFSGGFGLCMGILPIWGFQLLVAIFFAVLFKLNKGLVILFANISIPPMIPLIIYLSYRAGAVWMPQSAIRMTLARSLSLASIRYNLRQYIYGSISLALAAGLITGLIIFILLKILKRKPPAVSEA
jgi:glycosyltransferase involved in cell wall biosynthesis